MSTSIFSNVPWGRVVLAAVGILVVLVASHVAFVALYSHVMETGHDAAFYEDFAQKTGPPFATLLSPFVTFLAVRFVQRKSASAVQAAVLTWVGIVVLNFIVLAVAGLSAEFFKLPHLLGDAAKAVGAAAAVLVIR